MKWVILQIQLKGIRLRARIIRLHLAFIKKKLAIFQEQGPEEKINSSLPMVYLKLISRQNVLLGRSRRKQVLPVGNQLHIFGNFMKRNNSRPESVSAHQGRKLWGRSWARAAGDAAWDVPGALSFPSPGCAVRQHIPVLCHVPFPRTLSQPLSDPVRQIPHTPGAGQGQKQQLRLSCDPKKGAGKICSWQIVVKKCHRGTYRCSKY